MNKVIPEKKIEDYLHLYLGCECVWFYGAENQLQYKTTVDGIKNNLVTTGLMRFPYTQDVPFETIKPILRPLSDMTEEEMKDIAIVRGIEEKDLLAVERITNSDIEGVKCHYNHQGRSLSHWMPFDELTAEQCRYLLSKHFDLFGLIESGLAIDKTTI